MGAGPANHVYADSDEGTLDTPIPPHPSVTRSTAQGSVGAAGIGVGRACILVATK